MSTTVTVEQQEEYIRQLPEGKYFCFKAIKKQLENITSEEKKIIYLLQAKTNYLQEVGKILEHKNSASFEEKIDIEIDFIKYSLEVRRNFAADTRANPGYQITPIKINCNVNQLGDIFYQLLNETQINNKPVMETTIANLARIICTCFVDKEEHELSVETIKTILSKSHPEKRPKRADRIEFK